MAKQDVAAAKQILLLGSGPELARSDGETHLHQAVEMGDLELVKLLVKAGADCSVEYQGHSMSDIARMKVPMQINVSYLGAAHMGWAGPVNRSDEIPPSLINLIIFNFVLIWNTEITHPRSLDAFNFE